MELDTLRFKECYKELTVESRKELRTLRAKLIRNQRRKIMEAYDYEMTYGKGLYEPPIVEPLTKEGAEEVIMTLIRNGYLPVTCTQAAKLRRIREREWQKARNPNI